MEQQVFYRTVKVDGLSIFYREDGAEGRSHHSFAARSPIVLAHVSAAADAAC